MSLITEKIKKSKGEQVKKRTFLLLFLLFGIIIIYSNEVYILKEGDTLYSLSQKYNKDIDSIIEVNKIKDITSLSVGSKIIIPDTSYAEKKYTVMSGDTLFSISKKFNLSLSNIMEYNGINIGDVIFLGQELRLDNISSYEVVDKPTGEVTIPEDGEEFIPYWPLNGSITEYSGRIQGVKIEGNSGDYIKAVSNGKVIWYDSFKGIGKVVLIEGDNGYDYLYGTKESLDVHMGVRISAGERLGRLKDRNTSLIFSVFENGKPLSNITEAPRWLLLQSVIYYYS